MRVEVQGYEAYADMEDFAGDLVPVDQVAVVAVEGDETEGRGGAGEGSPGGDFRRGGSDLRTGLDVGFVGFEEVRPLIRRFLPVAARTGERLRVRARLSRLESEESEESFSSGIAGGEVARDRAAAERVTGAK
jgi:hypothetical protein